MCYKAYHLLSSLQDSSSNTSYPKEWLTKSRGRVCKQFFNERGKKGEKDKQIFKYMSSELDTRRHLSVLQQVDYSLGKGTVIP